MNEPDFLAFEILFKEACLKCFGYPLKDPLTETESKLFYNKVFELTGLTIGWKSIKNYSVFIIGDSERPGLGAVEHTPPGKQENPSVATLDTLSRYVLDAPYTTETERKKKEGHYPYWYRYREQVLRDRAGGERILGGAGEGTKALWEPAAEGIAHNGRPQNAGRSGKKIVQAGVIFTLLALAIIVLTLFFRREGERSFTDDFHSLQEDTLAARGWLIRSKDETYWNRRSEGPGCLSLFTLKGDNWPDPVQTPDIQNLLLRKIPCDCFTLEIRLKDFIPRQNWQQAGILLLEDTSFRGKSLRITIAYNDYNGGFPKLRQILIQAITSMDASGKPEEIAHIPLFNVDSLDQSPLLARNLENSALRIEKRGEKFRFLYSNGISANTSFKEMVSHEFTMSPRYAGLFALKGFVDSAAVIPACFHYFSLDCEGCGK